MSATNATMKLGIRRKPRRRGLASFENHVFPTLGGRETATLKPAELVAVILPVWTENHDTGTRLYQRIQAVFDQAIKIDDDGRFKDKVNVAGGLLNRLPTGLRPPVRHMRCSGARFHSSTPPCAPPRGCRPRHCAY